MKHWHFHFTGRKLGSFGAMQDFYVCIDESGYERALCELYSKYSDIRMNTYYSEEL